MKTWNQLSPYGMFDHSLGKQYICLENANVCIKKTKNWLFRLKLKRIPVYIGHPDDPYFQDSYKHLNDHVYGYVADLKADGNGLWARIHWTPQGLELINNRHYTHLSPRWEMKKDPLTQLHHPVRLISVGLTEQPNLPVQALCTPPHPHPGVNLQDRADKIAILRFTQKVQQRMEATGESYPEAWHKIYQQHSLSC